MHNSNLDDAASAENLKNKEERRERSVGMKIGKTCYYLFKKGRPDTDFPDLLLLQSMNELDVGEINHSEQFPAKFLPYVAEEVEHRLNSFLHNRLEQTGFRPVGKVIADKATFKHRTRQFVSFVTVVPNSTDLIQPIFLDIHVVTAGHTGLAIAKSLFDLLNKKDITAEQYQGGSYDGQYHHLSVPELLDGHFGFTGANRKYSDWDPMHIAGTRDVAIRKETQYSWLVQITEDISSLFKAINWGQEFEHFFSVAERLKSDESFEADVFRGFPMFYSETKFANHCAKVYGQLRKDYPALFSTLEETQMHNSGARDAKSRQTAADAAQLKNKIANKMFVLTLSGVCDIYDTFGHGINILQIVSILPHERFDKFNEVCVEKLLQMSKVIESHEKCPLSKDGKRSCLWPKYHADLQSVLTTGKYRGIPILDDNPEQNRTRRGFFTVLQNQRMDVVATATTRIKKLAERLSEELSVSVFDDQATSLVEQLRPLLDLRRLANKVKLRGSTMIGSLEARTFVKNGKKIASNIIQIPDVELAAQYKEFLRRLEKVTSRIQEKDQPDSMGVLKMFLDSARGLYLGIEMVMHVLSVASISMSVESVVESHVSVYESRINKKRNVSEDRGRREMEISLNGPIVSRCGGVVKAAMTEYWRKESKRDDFWHFIRKSERIQLQPFEVSKVIDGKFKEKSKLPIMDK